MATTLAADQTDVGDAVLDRMVEPDPHNPGRAHARLVDHGTPVWAIIAYPRGTDGDIGRTAADYLLPGEAVHAAMRYYERNRAYIDAFILLNDEPWES